MLYYYNTLLQIPAHIVTLIIHYTYLANSAPPRNCQPLTSSVDAYQRIICKVSCGGTPHVMHNYIVAIIINAIARVYVVSRYGPLPGSSRLLHVGEDLVYFGHVPICELLKLIQR